jgi:penicillin-binding protein 1A
VVKTAKRLGIKSKIYPVYPSALGASEMTLLELVSAYSTIATGKRVEPECIDRIIDKQTTSLQEPTGKTETVIHQAALSDIRTMLETVVKEGTGRKALSLNRTVYGKTGTTNNNVDALFVGFDDKFAVAVWVGKDNYESIGEKETGARAALPIWINFMDTIPNAGIEIAEKEKEEKKPIRIVPITAESLKLLRSATPTTIEIHRNLSAEPETYYDPLYLD